LITLPLILSLVLPCATAWTPPPWYSGNHAVLIVVDGLGDGYFGRLRSAGHLEKSGQRFVSEGWQVPAASSFWPARGADEARSVARGQRLTLDANSASDPPGVEAWPQGSFAVFGAKDGRGLHALLGALPPPRGKARPPILAVVHEGGFAAAVARHGAGSVEAGRALATLDQQLEATFEAYRARGLADATFVALVSPAGISFPTKRIDQAKLFRGFRRGRGQRSTRLTTLLRSFEPVEVATRGGVALLSLRQSPDSEAAPAAADYGVLVKGVGLTRNRGAALLVQLAGHKGIELVIAREPVLDPGVESLLVVGGGGRARLERRGEDQLRYRVLAQPDPLHLGETPASLGQDRFHAAAVWREAARQLDWADAPARAAHLLDLREGAALAVVARSGFRFDDARLSAGPAAKALILWSGPGLTARDAAALRTVDVTPTLLALVGAPLDERLEGSVWEEPISANAATANQRLCREMVARAVAAFSTSRVHDATVIDTTEVRRFSRPPRYFAGLRAALRQDDPLGYLPDQKIQQQIGPRRSLLIVATGLSARIERLVLKQAPNEIRRFDPLIRPELMLMGFLEDPVMRSRLRILEGPRQRALQQAATAP